MAAEIEQNTKQGDGPTPSWWEIHWRGVVGVALFIILAVLFGYVATTGNTITKASVDAAGLLALIAAAAVGIERAIEGLWTVVGQLTHAWWPMNEMAAQITELEGDLNDRLAEVYKSVAAVTNSLDANGNVIETKLNEAEPKIADMKKRIEELQGLAKDNQRVNLIAATALQNVAILEQQYPAIQSSVGVANQAIAGLTDFAASFRDNPARRMFSLVIGAVLGLIVAWIMRLDVFLAVFGSAPQVQFMPYVGVALSGLLIGLGSGPTHDVVAVLQEVKKLRASQSQPGPETAEVMQPGPQAATGRDLVAGPAPVRRFR
jgi:hypothetical protein